MKTITDYFSKAYCVNLDHRTDKWEETLKEFNKHNLEVERFSGVDGDTVNYDGPLKKGVIGCALSHKGIVHKAKLRGHETVLIFEDDVAFEEGANEKFYEWISEVPEDWDMLYLGGNHNVKTIKKATEHTMRCTKTQTTHAYALRNTVYDWILERLTNIDLDVDVIYTELQKVCKAYCFTPRIAWQREGVSDIWKQTVNYDFLKDNDGQHASMKEE